MDSRAQIAGNFSPFFELLAGHVIQLCSEFNGRRIRFRAGALIPSAQSPAQVRQKKVVNHRMDSWRMLAFQHLEPVIDSDQCMNLTQGFQTILRLGKILVVTPL